VSFIWPQMLVVLALVPIGVYVARRVDRRRRLSLAALVGTKPGRPPQRARVRDRVPAILIIAGFVVLAIGLARPQLSVPLPRVEGTVMLTFDVSGSMAANDAVPTRMEAAKATARAIVERQPPGVVIGVAAFSDGGLAVLPPTRDRTDVLAAIERLAPTRGTSVGQGILAALAAIQRAAAGTPREYYSNRSPEPTPAPAPVAPGSYASAVIVVLSDGENTAPPNPLAAAQVAADAGIRVIALGVGSPQGATLEVEGFRVHTQLDEATLRQVSEVAAGVYHRADDPEAVDAVFEELRRAVVVRSEELEVTALFAALALALLVLGGAASLIRSGRLP
jgi:Ca-activated chloride channel family protein